MDCCIRIAKLNDPLTAKIRLFFQVYIFILCNMIIYFEFPDQTPKYYDNPLGDR